MRIVLAHPGQQHSFKVARALKKEGLLYKYITAIYDSSDSVLMKILHCFLSREDEKKAQSRRDPYLDQDVVTYYTFLSLMVIALSRISLTKKLSYKLDRKVADWFGVRVARYAIKHKVDAVICFSMNEAKCFDLLKKNAPSIIRIVDCANSPVLYMKHIYDRDKFCTYLKEEVPSFWNTRVLKKQQQGIDLTDFFLAPSDFVRRGLMYCGVAEEKIKILHYGSNFKPTEKSYSNTSNQPLRLIYVGQVTYRKGLPYLLEAFSQLSGEDVILNIVGAWRSNSGIVKKYKSNPKIHFYGHISRERVKELLLQSDVFVFSSLTEGFSLSVLEAMSVGLPVIVSTNCGTNDIVKEGVTGYTFEYNDVIRLKKLIEVFLYNREKIQEMGTSARLTSQQYNWDFYSRNLSEICNQI